MGSIMRAALVLAIVLIFAGTARAQFGGENISSASGSINGAGSLNSHHSTPTSSTSSVNPDASVNMNSKNPGEFVPSTFSNYKDVLATAKLEAELRPMTLAEAARLEHERKKQVNDKAVFRVEEDEHGKLVIVPASQ
jgi:hypothetical protein